MWFGRVAPRPAEAPVSARGFLLAPRLGSGAFRSPAGHTNRVRVDSAEPRRRCSL